MAVDEEAKQEAILKRRMESKASRTEVDRLTQIAQGKKEIEELQKPFVGAPMPNYDPSQIEQDPEKRKEKIHDAMGVDSGLDKLKLPEVEISDDVSYVSLTPEFRRAVHKFRNYDMSEDEYGVVHGYDKKTGKLIWVEEQPDEFRYANKDDLYRQELEDFITA